MPREIITLQVG
jgi:tubulin gamma